MKFSYIAIDQNSAVNKGIVEAESLKAATRILVEKGWYVKKIKLKSKDRVAVMEISFGRVPLMDKMLFVRHLGTMLASGISLNEAIIVIAEQANSPRLKKILNKVNGRVKAGQSLSDALATYRRDFDPFFINIIKVGEESGTLEENLTYLAGELEDSIDLRRKIKTASFYPSIILSATFGLGLILAYFVLPKIKDLFTSLNFKLPLSTRILLWVADLFDRHGLLILLGVIGFVIGLRIVISLKPVKPVWHALLLRLPLVGHTIANYNLIIISRALNILLKSGLTIDQSVKVTIDVVKNKVYQKQLIFALGEVEKGEGLSNIFGSIKQSKHHPIFPLLAIKMISIGERTGKLDESFGYLASFYEKEVDAATENFTTTIEPLLLIVVGLIVGFVAISVISPIYQVTGQFRR